MKKKIKKTKEADFESTPVYSEKQIAIMKWLMAQLNEQPPEEVKETEDKKIENKDFERALVIDIDDALYICQGLDFFKLIKRNPTSL